MLGGADADARPQVVGLPSSPRLGRVPRASILSASARSSVIHSHIVASPLQASQVLSQPPPAHPGAGTPPPRTPPASSCSPRPATRRRVGRPGADPRPSPSSRSRSGSVWTGAAAAHRRRTRSSSARHPPVPRRGRSAAESSTVSSKRLPALLEGDAGGRVVAGGRTRADAGDEAPVGKVVQRDQGLRELEGSPGRRLRDRRADSEVTRSAESPAPARSGRRSTDARRSRGRSPRCPRSRAGAAASTVSRILSPAIRDRSNRDQRQVGGQL